MSTDARAASLDPVAANGLVQVRWLLIALQTLIGLGFLIAGDPEHRPLGMLGVTALLACVDLGRSWGLRLPILAHAAVDLAALALLSILWGPHHPLQPLALVEMTIVATVLPARLAWTITGLAVALQFLDAGLQMAEEDALHLLSHVATGAVAAVTLTWFALAIGRSLREREAARVEAEANKDRAARLAVVGTLAAGVAHEIATPLGSIALLTEELGAEAGPRGDALTAEVQRQVRRCRDILDRLLQRGDAPLVPTPDFGRALASWVEDWRASRDGVDLSVDIADDLQQLTVRGEEQTWRAAVWTLLDNAHRAGQPIRLHASAGERAQIEVLDSGPGLTPTALIRAGEPFYSAWSNPGRGLGLYALRSSIDALGGELHLQNHQTGGARARLVVPPAEAP